MTESLGTPIRCGNCGAETKIRLTKGTSLKNVLCTKCGHQGFTRNTEYDKEVRKEAKP